MTGRTPTLTPLAIANWVLVDGIQRWGRAQEALGYPPPAAGWTVTSFTGWWAAGAALTTRVRLMLDTESTIDEGTTHRGDDPTRTPSGGSTASLTPSSARSSTSCCKTRLTRVNMTRSDNRNADRRRRRRGGQEPERVARLRPFRVGTPLPFLRSLVDFALRAARRG